MWAMSLSPAEFDQMLGDLSRLDRKTRTAYLQLLGYLRRFGSVPANDRALASIMSVTPRYLREVAWPLLQDRLVLSPDGNRYFDPEITTATTRQPAPKPPVDPNLSADRSRAGTKGGLAKAAKQASLSVVEASGPDFACPDEANGLANGLANPSKPLAKDVANSTPVASGLNDFATDFASEVARAPKPNLTSSPFSQPTESLSGSEKGSVGEVSVARASAGAAGKQTQANGLAKRATDQANGLANGLATQANGQAKSLANRPPGRTRMTEDWQPSERVALYCVNLLGCDLAETLEAFRDHFLANGETKLDWNAALRGWCRRKMEFDAQRRMPLVRSIARPEKPPSNGFDAVALRRGFGGKPVLDGVAEPSSNPVTDFLALEARKNAG